MCVLSAALCIAGLCIAAPPPIAVSPANPRYFSWRNRTAVALLSSGEHYGALVNLDFNYETYFAALAARNYSLTIALAGTYREPDSDVNRHGDNPAGNTLSPVKGRFASPWASAPAAGSAGKYDLRKWNSAYWDRLGAFVASASRYDIVVHLTLFCVYDAQPGQEYIWALNPMNPANNVNGGMDNVNSTTAYTLGAGKALVAFQLALVTKLTRALMAFDNVLISLVLMPEGAGVAWGAEIFKAVRAADPRRAIVVPGAWLAAPAAAALPWRGDRNVVATGAMSFAPPPANATDGLRPCILDSAPLPVAPSAQAQLATLRRTYYAWLLSGGGAIYNLDWSYAVSCESGTKVDNQTSITPSGPRFEMLLSAIATLARSLPLAALEASTAWVAAASLSGAPSREAAAKVPGPTLVGLRSTATARAAIHSVRVWIAYVASANVTALRVDLGDVATGDACVATWLDPRSALHSAASAQRAFTPKLGEVIAIALDATLAALGEALLRVECTARTRQ
jgi:hypothetical protein